MVTLEKRETVAKNVAECPTTLSQWLTQQVAFTNVDILYTSLQSLPIQNVDSTPFETSWFAKKSRVLSMALLLLIAYTRITYFCKNTSFPNFTFLIWYCKSKGSLSPMRRSCARSCSVCGANLACVHRHMPCQTSKKGSLRYSFYMRASIILLKIKEKSTGVLGGNFENTCCSKLIFTLLKVYNSRTKNRTMWSNIHTNSKKYTILRDINFIWE